MPDDEKKKQGELDFGVLGFSGLKQYGGTIEEEWHPKLRGEYGPKLYREMTDNSSVIGAISFIVQALVRQVEWRVEQASADKEAIEWAAFLESCLIDMSHTFEDFISEVLSFFPYGWSYFETVYKIRRADATNKDDPTVRSQYSDGKIGWRKLALRAQDTLDHWEFDEEDGGLRGMHQTDETSGQTAYIPIEKALLFRTSTYKNNPEGRSLYRNAVVDYFYLKRISEIEAIGIERDMTGVIAMQVPVDLLRTDADSSAKALRAELERMLGQLKRDEREYIMVPSETDRDGKPTGYKFELVNSGGKRQIDTNATKNYYKVNILQSVMAQFIQLGMQNVGSFALASSQTDLFAVALGAYLDVISSTFNRFAVSRLMEMNNAPREYWPTLEHGDLEGQALGEIGGYVQALATAGVIDTTDEALQRKLLEMAKLPQPEKEEGDHVQKHRTPGGLCCKHWDRKTGKRRQRLAAVGG